MSNKTLQLTEQLYPYLLKVGTREPEVLRRLREETLSVRLAIMQICPEQGQLMNLLVRLTGARKCLEIGTYTGYSALCVALALPADGKLICCDINAEWTTIAQRYWREAGVADKIELRLAPALETIEQLRQSGQSGSFDFAFIDADKANYDAYYEAALQLLCPGGFIGVDNTLWFGKPADPDANDSDTQAIRALNAKIHADARVHMSMLPIGDGLTLAQKI